MSEEEEQQAGSKAGRGESEDEGDEGRLPPSRRGKKAVTAYVDPETHKQLRMLGLELGMSSQDIIIEALEGFFERHGKTRKIG